MRLEEEFRLIRLRGFSTDVEEFQAGVSCVAAPFLDRGTIVASYTVSVPSERFQARRETLLAAVLAAATKHRRGLSG